jgi:hypothetical protein
MLFATGICFLVAPLFEGRTRRDVWIALLLVPVLLAGIIANTRRIAWVELGVGLSTLFFASRWSPWKRRLSRALVFASPFVVAYLALGWNHHGGVFRPVEVIQSVVDSKADASTEWRDWENYDLFFTIRQTPLLGTGYGHGFIETVKLPDISQAYALYRFIPHNSILGLLTYGGLVGFALLWLLLPVGVYLGARAYRFASRREDRAAALMVPTVLSVYLAHCYGDMGLGTWTAVFLVSPTLAIAAKLAASTGAWPMRGVIASQAPAAPRVVGFDVRQVHPSPAWSRR